MRKQYNGLAHLVQSSMGRDVFDGSLYVFCNKSKNTLKVLYWDNNGFCVWAKRLERHRFPWPKDHAEARAIDAEYFLLLLKGIDIFSEHPKLEFFNVS
jgi:transposase